MLKNYKNFLLLAIAFALPLQAYGASDVQTKGNTVFGKMVGRGFSSSSKDTRNVTFIFSPLLLAGWIVEKSGRAVGYAATCSVRCLNGKGKELGNQLNAIPVSQAQDKSQVEALHGILNGASFCLVSCGLSSTQHFLARFIANAAPAGAQRLEKIERVGAFLRSITWKETLVYGHSARADSTVTRNKLTEYLSNEKIYQNSLSWLEKNYKEEASVYKENMACLKAAISVENLTNRRNSYQQNLARDKGHVEKAGEKASKEQKEKMARSANNLAETESALAKAGEELTRIKTVLSTPAVAAPAVAAPAVAAPAVAAPAVAAPAVAAPAVAAPAVAAPAVAAPAVAVR